MIKIIKDYYLDSDEHNYILVKWAGNRDKNGKLIINSRHYYSTWGGLTNGLETALLREAIQAASTLGQLESLCMSLRHELQDCLSRAFTGAQGD